MNVLDLRTRLRGFVFCWMACTILSGTAAWSAVHYVSPTGNAGGLAPGYMSIQDAINAAAEGDEIRIAAGVYDQITTISTTLSTTRQVAHIAKPLIVTGGYSDDFSQWDPATHETILDAHGEGRGIFVIGPGYDRPTNQGAPGRIDVKLLGLRVINGDGAASPGVPGTQYPGSGNGGGLYVQWTTLSLTDCAFTSNTAALATDPLSQQWSVGGAIAAFDSSLTILRCRFDGNDAGRSGDGTQQGGAIFSSGYMSSLRVEDSEFAGNRADAGSGGTIYVSQSLTYLRGNTIRQGYTRDNGTVCLDYIYSQWPAIVPCTVRENQFLHNVAGRGGAIHLNVQSAHVFRNLFEANEATAAGGGALSIPQNFYEGPNTTDSMGVTVDNNVFLDNAWTGTDLPGGWRGGDAILAGGTDSSSGGYYAYYGHATTRIRHNTFNRAGGGSAALNLTWGQVSLVNNIVVNHPVGVRVNVLEPTSGDPYEGNFSLDHTLFSGNGQNVQLIDGALSETATLDVPEPGLDADRIHLLPDSPAVDAGAATNVNVDYDGQHRPSGAAPDVGAIETILTHAENQGNVDLSLAANPPIVTRIYKQNDDLPHYLLIQEYAAVIANNLTTPSLETYALEQRIDPLLSAEYPFSWPNMDYQDDGSTLTWQSRSPLPAQDRAFTSVVGLSEAWTPGDALVSSAKLTYTPTGGAPQALTADVSTTLPFVIPVITTPGNGEILPPLPGEPGIEIMGIAMPGSTIRIYENDVATTDTVTSTSGVFRAWYHPNFLNPGQFSVLTARDVTQEARPSPPSKAVTLEPAAHPWCPQRSTWELHYMAGGHARTLVYRFRDRAGNFSTRDWVIPRLPGPINDGALKLYAYCRDDGAAPEAVSLTIGETPYPPTQIGTEPPVYQFFNGPMIAGQWIRIAVTCGGEPDVSIGQILPILIDPDGFVFDATLGFDPDHPTQHALANTKVTCMQWSDDRGGWIEWPAEMYENQINPQITGADGYFAFFTPPGFYYLQASDQAGFQPWRSPVIQVVSEIVHVNIPLTPVATEAAAVIDITPGATGPVAPITIQQGEIVEWRASAKGLNAPALLGYGENPVVHALSSESPYNPLGWDSGMLRPGETYRRAFTVPGTYPYADGLGNTGVIHVEPPAPPVSGVGAQAWTAYR